jgi:hypothetical protein
MIMSDLDYMESIANIPCPKLAHLHLPAPHTPQVLDPDVEFIKGDRLVDYTYAITYLNKCVFEISSKIIAQSKVPPVFMLQGDHDFFEDASTRMYNLNAYYLPGEGKKLVYPTITPVNTFRILFNAYFGGKYPMLKDVSNWYVGNYYFDFKQAPTICTQ